MESATNRCNPLNDPTIRDNILIARLQRLVVSPNIRIIFMLQIVIALEDKDDLDHRVEIGVRHTVREDNRSGIIYRKATRKRERW